MPAITKAHLELARQIAYIEIKKEHKKAGFLPADKFDTASIWSLADQLVSSDPKYINKALTAKVNGKETS